jgi:hypothetical protein
MQWTSLPVKDIDLLLPEVNDFLNLSNIGPSHPLLGAICMSDLIRGHTEHDCLKSGDRLISVPDHLIFF